MAPNLLNGLKPAEVKAEYEGFLASLGEFPAEQRLNRVLSERLWDRRSP